MNLEVLGANTRRGWILALALALLLASSKSAVGCSLEINPKRYPLHQRVSAAFVNASLVVEAVAMDSTTGVATTAVGTFERTHRQYGVRRAWKGAPAAVITVDETFDICACGPLLQPGRVYILYLNTGWEDGVYNRPFCSGVHAIDEADIERHRAILDGLSAR